MTRVTMAHLQRCGFCARGARRWFEAYKFDFREFLKCGIDAETLRATGDARALKAVKEAEKSRG
jgi:arsenate reductase-like glutaredoxin family protein